MITVSPIKNNICLKANFPSSSNLSNCSTRCKGQAFLTFDSDLGAKLALKLNGSAWEDVEEPGVSAKKKKNGSSDKTKELKLKVTKVLNRHMTKKKVGK